MATNVTIPPLGESITEATVGQWLKAPVDKVKADEPIVSLETDKVAVEVPSPVDGIMGAQLVQVGDTVTIGATIARIEEAPVAKAAPPAAAPAPAPAAAPAPTPVAAAPAPAPTPVAAPAAAPPPPAPQSAAPASPAMQPAAAALPVPQAAAPAPPMSALLKPEEVVAPVSLLKPASEKVPEPAPPPAPSLIKPAPPPVAPAPPISLIKPREPAAAPAEAGTPTAEAGTPTAEAGIPTAEAGTSTAYVVPAPNPPAALAPASTSTPVSASASAAPMPPSVRRAVSENDIDPATLAGTGRDGRPTKADVLAAIEAGSAKLKAHANNDAERRPAPAASGMAAATVAAPEPAAVSVAAPEPAVTAAATGVAPERPVPVQAAPEPAPAAPEPLRSAPVAAAPAAAPPPSAPVPAATVSPPTSTAVTPPPAEVQTVVPVPAAQPAPPPALRDPSRPEERVRMTRLRQTIARRLKEAQNTAAMLTTFNDVDMTAVMATRTRYKDLFEKKHGVRLGFMSFFVKAAVLALRDVPAVNAAIDGDEIVYHDFADIGVAVSSPGGLVVPVLKNADKRNFAEIELAIADFGKRAQAGKLTLADMAGGTFTITNGGVFGSLMSTPILNPPQSGVLGMHRIEERPVVVAGQIVIRPMMYLALSYDHRLVDGREAVSFLVRIKEAIEDPTRLLVDL